MERGRESKVKPLDYQSDYSPSVKLQHVGYWHQVRGNDVSQPSNQLGTPEGLVIYHMLVVRMRTSGWFHV